MKIYLLLLLTTFETLIRARPIPEGLPPYPVHFPKYEFGYQVHDGYTGDLKSQHEVRNGDHVAGHYSVLDPDGRKRTVQYRANDITGFNAVVHRDGHIPTHHGNHAGHPVHQHQFHTEAVVPAPVPIGPAHPPPPPPPGPHHEPVHHNSHHDNHHLGGGGYNEPHGQHHHAPPPPPPPPNFGGHPVAHSSAFQHNYYHPYP